jgi:protein HIRA/HIR1
LTLYAASSDGTIAVFNFSAEELEGIAPHSVQEQYLTKFGFSSPPIPEGYSHVSTTQITPPPSPSRSAEKPPQSETAGFGNGDGGGEQVNMLVAKRSNKKRANLTTQVGSVPSAGASGIVTNGKIAGSSAPISKRAQLAPVRDTAMSSMQPQSPISFPSPSEQPFDAPDSWSRHADVAMDLDVPIDALETHNSSTNSRGKRKASAIIDLTDEVKHTKARTLGGDRQRDIVTVKEIGLSDAVLPTVWGAPQGISLPVPALLTALTAEIDCSEDVFEGRNSEEDSGSFFAVCDGFLNGLRCCQVQQRLCL